MVLPLVPLVLIGAGAASGLGGLVTGARGAGKMREAGRIAEGAKANYEKALAQTHRAVDDTNAKVAAYGVEQDAARRQVLHRMAEFIRRHERQVSESAAVLLDGVEAEIGEIADFAGTIGLGLDWLAGAAKAGFTGAATFTGIPAAVSALGTASTGTAISSLSGAAAQSATGAWLGGGSLAAGGGGVALGATALNFVTVGPALLVGGLVLNGQGEKAKTRANAYEAEVTIAVANQQTFRSLLATVDARVDELSQLLAQLVSRAVGSLAHLEQEPFDPERHAERFRRAMALTLAVRDMAATPILTSDGELNSETERLLIKYREET